MPPSHSGLAPWTANVLPLLLPLFLGIVLPASPCPAPCVCASDITSCTGLNLSSPPFNLSVCTSRLDLSHNTITTLSASWASQTLHRLTALVLNRNSINQIQENAFAQTPQLTSLDLSSNQLAALNSSMFTGLAKLQELLLFGNRISHIATDTFQSFIHLQRLYLSGNFAKWTKELDFLDFSSNRLAKLPVQTLLSLQGKSDIYLHDNPLTCDCPERALMEYWSWKQYRPVADFGPECKSEDSKCGQQDDSDVQEVEEVYEYQVDPGRELSVPSPMPRYTVLPNGTLEIHSALEEDSGTYGCVTSRGRHLRTGESLEVTVVVGNLSINSALEKNQPRGHFNTAFTTLASCLISIALVLLYLFTPCKCGRNGRGCGGRAIVICSDPTEVETGQRRTNGKRVAFLEPQVEECNSEIKLLSSHYTSGIVATAFN
uniref:Adhesion molecule with Ig like domain 2 n=1 Tax=Neogobius melanostomus TaxID=47308 RepID=A0A8C6UFT6_9GOBI